MLVTKATPISSHVKDENSRLIERERHLTTGKRAERTKLDFRFPICHSANGQAK